MFLKRVPLLLALTVMGCTQPGEHLLGTEPSMRPVCTISALKSATAPITLLGTMTDKCPTAACWFHLKDTTGIIKVDVKAAGFTVTDVPNGTEMRVFGRYSKETGEVEATGLRW